MLRSLRLIQKLGPVVGMQKLGSHRVASCNATEARFSSVAYQCLEDDSVVVPYCINHQHCRNYVTDENEDEVEEKPYPIPAKYDPFHRADKQLKRHGFTFINLVQDMLQAVNTAGILNYSEALLMLQSCGDHLITESIESRRAITATVWQTIKNLDPVTNVLYYNTYLLVTFQNETYLSPDDILKEMMERDVEPDYMTFQRLIEHCCSQGDVDGASSILKLINGEGHPLNEKVFSSLIRGYSVSGNLPGAMKILDEMNEAGVEPTSVTFATIICVHARQGDIQSIFKVIGECQQRGTTFSFEEILEVIYTLAICGFSDQVDKMIKFMVENHIRPDMKAANSYINKLIHRDLVAVAYKIQILLTAPGRRANSESAFIKKLVAGTKDVERIVSHCKQLGEQYQNDLFRQAIFYAFVKDRHFLALPLLEAWHDSGEIIEEEHFRHFFDHFMKKEDVQESLKTVKIMISDFKIMPYVSTLQKYVMPLLTGDPTEMAQTLQSLGVNDRVSKTAVSCYLLQEGKCRESADFIASTNVACLPKRFISYLSIGFRKNKDIRSLVQIVFHQYSVLVMDYTITQGVENIQDDRLISAPKFSGEALQEVFRGLYNDEEHFASVILTKFLEKGIRIHPEYGEAIQRELKERGFDQSLIVLVSKLMSEELELQPLPADETFELSVAESVLEQKNKVQEIINLVKSNQTDELEQKLQKLEISDRNDELYFELCCNLVNYYALKENLNETEEWYRQLIVQFPINDIPKSVLWNYSNLLVAKGRGRDATKLLQEFKYKVRDSENSSSKLDSPSRSEEKNLKEIKEVFDESKIAKSPTKYNSLRINQLLKSHLQSDEIEEALEKFEWACTNLKTTPCAGLLMGKLVKTQDAKALQHVIKLYTNVHGEMQALLHLAVVYAECNEPNQVKRVLRTPGITFSWARLMNQAKYMKDRNDIKSLRHFTLATFGLFKNPTPLLMMLLDAYEKKKDWKRALSLWMKMQEDDITPNSEFLKKLEKILLDAKQKVPFTTSDVIRNTVHRLSRKLKQNNKR
ncbi:hypothetical protein QAD02_009228 [Eretmocerus hayati]|uniref:Uncharacterized protein n=1 Tax=Eretmocerus hayati TaxID=131215 RepID=A0ACC2N8N6_9HYME|nr:hypothetical protein QAD02_009228 [Eretmocerus hayati]